MGGLTGEHEPPLRFVAGLDAIDSVEAKASAMLEVEAALARAAAESGVSRFGTPMRLGHGQDPCGVTRSGCVG